MRRHTRLLGSGLLICCLSAAGAGAQPAQNGPPPGIDPSQFNPYRQPELEGMSGPPQGFVEEMERQNLQDQVLFTHVRPAEKGTFLGISTSAPPPVLYSQLDLPQGTGVVVDFVKEASPAQKAGVQKNDILKKLDDQILIDSRQLAVLVRLKKPGDEIALTLLRQGKEQVVKATLEEGDVALVDFPGGMGMAEYRLVNPKAGTPLQAFRGELFEIHSPKVNVTIDQSPGKGGMIVIKDPQGNLLFEGPLPIKDEIWTKKIPPEVRARIENMGINIVVPSTQPMSTPPSGATPPEGFIPEPKRTRP